MPTTHSLHTPSKAPLIISDAGSARTSHQPLVFSGIQPTGVMHIGNYFGALKRFVALQKRYRCLFCIVDLHAITVSFDPEQLLHHTRMTLATFLAAGIDPSEHLVFVQSHVPAHTELAWILNCVARIGWLNRMTQFKDKAGSNRQNASLGLYAYPALMAADILAYRADAVPVGEDQKQHLELARDVAQKFNTDFRGRIEQVTGEDSFFPLPEPLIDGPATRVRSLRDGTKKMSKSDPSAMSLISLLDDADTIALKIRKARTDPAPLPDSASGLEGRPEAANLIEIFSAAQNTSVESTLQQYAGSKFSVFKNDLAETLIDLILPLGERIREWMEDANHLDRIVSEGSATARTASEAVLKEVRQIIGLRPISSKLPLITSSGKPSDEKPPTKL